MRIIISPAKKMVENTDVFETTSPSFICECEKIKSQLQSMDYQSLQKLWKCNDSIARLNFERLCDMNLYQNLTPAILGYEGLQYKHIAPNIFTFKEFDYAEEHLRIISGFYGVLKPSSGVTPYRLEMQSKLSVGGSGDLYSFWGDRLGKSLQCETDFILNLASKEYSKGVAPHFCGEFITCLFAQNVGGKLVEKGTACKMARGEMVRFLCENNIKTTAEIKDFCGLGYRFSKENSTASNIMFIKGE